ncbi:hypothetical protein EXIGLDRAFT_763643 [Exidia glandulosa HHB12029]|uniref:F-box domain-containing protein n=1 Tax=Exidia glandulosa HHB12029 TaxID=1314781 RepID=A0A166B6P1_EXIGL|nr:hypothetical protein EXIGLDRAFT_763643 [Exidia glandulosa HHB12029]
MPQPSRLIPTEIVEEIIDGVSDHSTLQSCSFVAKSWRPRVLTHIFRSFVLCGSLPCVFTDARPRNVYQHDRFARLLDEDPHLAVYMREIAIHAESMTSIEFLQILLTLLDGRSSLPSDRDVQRLRLRCSKLLGGWSMTSVELLQALLTLRLGERRSSPPIDWDVQRLVLRWSKLLDGWTLAHAGAALSEVFPSLRTLQLDGWVVDSHNLIEFAASFPALAELTLNVAPHHEYRFHRVTGRPPTPPRSTCRLPHLRRLVVQPGCKCTCHLPTLLPVLRQRAPKVEHVELRVSLPAHRELFTHLPSSVDGWIKRLDIRLDRGLPSISLFKVVTRHCSRIEELYLTWAAPIGIHPKVCSFPPSRGKAGNSFAANLVALRVFHITLDIRDLGGFDSIPVSRDWKKLEDDLLRNAHFTQLWLHVTVGYLLEASARRTLNALLPRLRTAQKVHTRYTVIPKPVIPVPRTLLHGLPRTTDGLL